MQPEMEVVKLLGTGSFGSVHLTRYPKPDGSMCYNAVKISDFLCYESLKKEFQILKKLKGCPRIVRCFGDSLLEDVDYNGVRVYKMVMEYASAGTLTSYIERNKNISGSVIKDFTRMILQGLVSIHRHGYVHCDLKPDNILLFPRYDQGTWDVSYDLKISDFGMSTKAGEESEYWSIDEPYVGTPYYMSPESVQDGTVEKTLDLWSLGCIVLEMYIGKQGWSGVDSDDLKTHLEDCLVPEIPDTVPCEAREFLETCFASKQEDRGSAWELLLHPFLTGEQMVAAGEERKPPVNRGSARKLKIIGPNKSMAIQEKTISILKPLQFKKVKPLKLTVKMKPPSTRASTFVPVQ